MDRARLLELAIAELERQRAGIREEIATLQNELNATGAAVRQMTSTASAGRKAAAMAKPAVAAGKPAAVVALVKPKTDAEKKALRLAMKRAWKRRTAAAAKMTKAK
jgi:hypothetical protein